MKPCHLFLLVATLLLGIAETSGVQTTMQPWLTRSADNSRTGWNSHETELTQESVAAKGIAQPPGSAALRAGRFDKSSAGLGHSAASPPVASAITYLPFGPASGLSYGNGVVEARAFDLTTERAALPIPLRQRCRT
jgi:hypothetical protein